MGCVKWRLHESQEPGFPRRILQCTVARWCLLLSSYEAVVPAPHQQHVLYSWQSVEFFSQAIWAVQTAEHIRLPASLTGIPAASWVTLYSDNYSLLTLTECSITLRNISQDNYLCMVSFANMPITDIATCTHIKSCRNGEHPLQKRLIKRRLRVDFWFISQWYFCYCIFPLKELEFMCSCVFRLCFASLCLMSSMLEKPFEQHFIKWH